MPLLVAPPEGAFEVDVNLIESAAVRKPSISAGKRTEGGGRVKEEAFPVSVGPLSATGEAAVATRQDREELADWTLPAKEKVTEETKDGRRGCVSTEPSPSQTVQLDASDELEGIRRRIRQVSAYYADLDQKESDASLGEIQEANSNLADNELGKQEKEGSGFVEDSASVEVDALGTPTTEPSLCTANQRRHRLHLQLKRLKARAVQLEQREQQQNEQRENEARTLAQVLQVKQQLPYPIPSTADLAAVPSVSSSLLHLEIQQLLHMGRSTAAAVSLPLQEPPFGPRLTCRNPNTSPLFAGSSLAGYLVAEGSAPAKNSSQGADPFSLLPKGLLPRARVPLSQLCLPVTRPHPEALSSLTSNQSEKDTTTMSAANSLTGTSAHFCSSGSTGFGVTSGGKLPPSKTLPFTDSVPQFPTMPVADEWLSRGNSGSGGLSVTGTVSGDSGGPLGSVAPREVGPFPALPQLHRDLGSTSSVPYKGSTNVKLPKFLEPAGKAGLDFDLNEAFTLCDEKWPLGGARDADRHEPTICASASVDQSAVALTPVPLLFGDSVTGLSLMGMAQTLNLHEGQGLSCVANGNNGTMRKPIVKVEKSGDSRSRSIDDDGVEVFTGPFPKRIRRPASARSTDLRPSMVDSRSAAAAVQFGLPSSSSSRLQQPASGMPTALKPAFILTPVEPAAGTSETIIPTKVEPASFMPTTVKPGLVNPTTVKLASLIPTTANPASVIPAALKHESVPTTALESALISSMVIKPTFLSPMTLKPASVLPSLLNPIPPTTVVPDPNLCSPLSTSPKSDSTAEAASSVLSPGSGDRGLPVWLGNQGSGDKMLPLFTGDRGLGDKMSPSFSENRGSRDKNLPPCTGTQSPGDKKLPPLTGNQGAGDKSLSPCTGNEASGDNTLPPCPGNQGCGDTRLQYLQAALGLTPSHDLTPLKVFEALQSALATLGQPGRDSEATKYPELATIIAEDSKLGKALDYSKASAGQAERFPRLLPPLACDVSCLASPKVPHLSPPPRETDVTLARAPPGAQQPPPSQASLGGWRHRRSLGLPLLTPPASAPEHNRKVRGSSETVPDEPEKFVGLSLKHAPAHIQLDDARCPKPSQVSPAIIDLGDKEVFRLPAGSQLLLEGNPSETLRQLASFVQAQARVAVTQAEHSLPWSQPPSARQLLDELRGLQSRENPPTALTFAQSDRIRSSPFPRAHSEGKKGPHAEIPLAFAPFARSVSEGKKSPHAELSFSSQPLARPISERSKASDADCPFSSSHLGRPILKGNKALCPTLPSPISSFVRSISEGLKAPRADLPCPPTPFLRSASEGKPTFSADHPFPNVSFPGFHFPRSSISPLATLLPTHPGPAKNPFSSHEPHVSTLPSPSRLLLKTTSIPTVSPHHSNPVAPSFGALFSSYLAAKAGSARGADAPPTGTHESTNLSSNAHSQGMSPPNFASDAPSATPTSYPLAPAGCAPCLKLSVGSVNPTVAAVELDLFPHCGHLTRSTAEEMAECDLELSLSRKIPFEVTGIGPSFPSTYCPYLPLQDDQGQGRGQLFASPLPVRSAEMKNGRGLATSCAFPESSAVLSTVGVREGSLALLGGGNEAQMGNRSSMASGERLSPQDRATWVARERSPRLGWERDEAGRTAMGVRGGVSLQGGLLSGEPKKRTRREEFAALLAFASRQRLTLSPEAEGGRSEMEMLRDMLGSREREGERGGRGRGGGAGGRAGGKESGGGGGGDEGGVRGGGVEGCLSERFRAFGNERGKLPCGLISSASRPDWNGGEKLLRQAPSIGGGFFCEAKKAVEVVTPHHRVMSRSGESQVPCPNLLGGSIGGVARREVPPSTGEMRLFPLERQGMGEGFARPKETESGIMEPPRDLSVPDRTYMHGTLPENDMGFIRTDGASSRSASGREGVEERPEQAVQAEDLESMDLAWLGDCVEACKRLVAMERAGRKGEEWFTADT
eukprot:TRINITY_DN2869_c0_g1_i1.p1 TRINITY_DN2869_c0_g1~~TRINITY_DN2869_c0_g1_i1.p1  ORF type:complete len:1947 (-),score=235.07 TRINITY_DN2869_c0_g1_i1:1310-7150(-)